MLNKLVAAAMTVLLTSMVASRPLAGTFTEVTEFGSNPGNLRMFHYVPDNLPEGRPLVVALHGCVQGASDYDDETGWTKYAEEFKFALLLPEQKRWNHWNRCFNWYKAGDISRDQGEALSIKQMMDKMRIDHKTNPGRTYVSGLSAGGAMAVALMATYPELFSGGASIAGLPYGCAEGLWEAWFTCMRRGKDLRPSDWGARVGAATNHAGPWPRLSIWQGGADTTVAPMNASELVEQWTEVHGIDRMSPVHDTVAGHPHTAFQDGTGRVVVEVYTIRGMDHGTPVKPGSGKEHCGHTAPYIIDAQICSSFYISKFWGLVQ